MTKSTKCDNIDSEDSEKVSLLEEKLLKAMQILEFGELIEVEIAEGEPEIKIELTTAQSKLIEAIRGGTQFFTKLMVHQGQPTSAEIHSTIAGFKAIKKIRF